MSESDDVITYAELQPSVILADDEIEEITLLGRSEPRRISPMETAETYTLDLVICSNSKKSFPEELLQNFEYSKNGELVSEIWYDSGNGKILQLGTTSDEKNDFGDQHARDDDAILNSNSEHGKWTRKQSAGYSPMHERSPRNPSRQRSRKHSVQLTQNQYARLLTTNWWYGTLSSNLLVASAVIMGKNSLACFCVNLLANHGIVHYPMSIYSRIFIIFFAWAIQILMVRSAIKRAHLDFGHKGDTNSSGDLVKEELTSCWDKYVPFWALVLFQLLEVNVMTRDIVKYLHPHKAKQPFTAFKADGHRAYLIGYQSEHAYRSKLSTLSIDELVLAMAMETTLVLCTVYSALKDGFYTYMVYSLPSVFVIYMKFSHAFYLVRHREHYWQFLRHTHQRGSETDKKAAEATRLKEFSSYKWETEKLNEFWWLVLKMFGAFIFVFTGAAIVYSWGAVNDTIAHGLIGLESLGRDKRS